MQRKDGYTAEPYADLFEQEGAGLEKLSREELLETLRHRDVYRYRVKTIRAGDMLECEIFPLWRTRAEAQRAKRIRESRPAQVRLNHRNLQKKVARLANANFTAEDLWITVGYDDDSLPASPEAARKELSNYLRRLKRKYQAAGIEMHYIYVTEWHEAGDGTPGIRVHHHIMLRGGLDRDVIEQAWHGGRYPQARRLQPRRDSGLTGLARYLVKATRGGRMWGHSISSTRQADAAQWAALRRICCTSGVLKASLVSCPGWK